LDINDCTTFSSPDLPQLHLYDRAVICKDGPCQGVENKLDKIVKVGTLRVKDGGRYLQVIVAIVIHVMTKRTLEDEVQFCIQRAFERHQRQIAITYTSLRESVLVRLRWVIDLTMTSPLVSCKRPRFTRHDPEKAASGHLFVVAVDDIDSDLVPSRVNVVGLVCKVNDKHVVKITRAYSTRRLKERQLMNRLRTLFLSFSIPLLSIYIMTTLYVLKMNDCYYKLIV